MKLVIQQRSKVMITPKSMIPRQWLSILLKHIPFMNTFQEPNQLTLEVFSIQKQMKLLPREFSESTVCQTIDDALIIIVYKYIKSTQCTYLFSYISSF